jgi:hypothetical protein
MQVSDDIQAGIRRVLFGNACAKQRKCRLMPVFIGGYEEGWRIKDVRPVSPSVSMTEEIRQVDELGEVV